MTQQEREQVNQLMLEFSKGNKKSYSKFCESYYHIYYSFIVARVYDDHVAKDLTQDLFVKIQELDFSTIRFDNMFSYFLKAAENLIKNYQYTKRTKEKYETELTEDIPYYDEYKDAAFSDLTKGLTDRELSILQLRFVYGYKLEEAAEKLGLGRTYTSKFTTALREKILKNKDALIDFVVIFLICVSAWVIAAT